MRRLLFVISTAFVAVMVPFTAEADRCNRKLDQTFAGTHVRALATFLPAPPGEPETELTSGAVINVLAEGKPGRGQIRGIARQTETMGPPEPPGPECAGFDVKSPVPTSSLVETFFRGNHQLYLNQVDSGDDYVCIATDPMNPRVSVHVTGDIVGGAGKYQNATGTFELNALLTPISPDEQFSAQTGTLTGNIVLDKPGCQ